MADTQTKESNLFIARRALDPVGPIVIDFEYAGAGVRSRPNKRTVVFTRNWKQTLSLSGRVESIQIPDGIELPVLFSSLLIAQPNKVLSKLRFYLTTQMAYTNLADIAVMARSASSDGIEVELIKVHQGEKMTIELEDLVTACLIVGVFAVPSDVLSIVWQALG